ncbi:MAG: hypothetical protein WB441_08115 [Nocardioidaceae bacterium]
MSSSDRRSDGATDEPGGGSRHRAGAFDIRTFIGALIGIYGLVLVVTGLLVGDGRTINIASGAGMVVVALGFIGWARWRPVVVPDKTGSDEQRG